MKALILMHALWSSLRCCSETLEPQQGMSLISDRESQVGLSSLVMDELVVERQITPSQDDVPCWMEHLQWTGLE
ncbi:hypothetical protein MC885_019672 [Smutsia gigantea]|nr:hypothetical protein MC885_019672 [Smutsia gigantea]